MISLRALKIITPTLFLSALLAACASSGDSPTGTPSEVQEIQTQLLGDMPLPQGARILGSDSIIIGRGNEWVGRAVVNALQGATDPPTFTLFVNRELPAPYLRYLERCIREKFEFGSTPIKMRVRKRSE